MTRNTTAIDWTTRMYMLLGLICATALTITAPDGMFIYAAYATASLFILVVAAEITANILQGGSVTGRARTVIADVLQPSGDAQQETTPLADSAVIPNEELPEQAQTEIEKMIGDRWVVGDTYDVKDIIKRESVRAKFIGEDESPIEKPLWEIDAGSEPQVIHAIDEESDAGHDVLIGHPEKFKEAYEKNP